MNKIAQQWIKDLDLIKHPEGGWFKEIYRSPEKLRKEHLPNRFSGDRNFSTSIYFLLTSAEFSAFHKIKQDELWYYHAGSAITLHVIDEKGTYFRRTLGNDVAAGEQLQVAINGGWLFAASLGKSNSYALAGCNVAPGFDFEDFEMPSQQALIETFPSYKKIILKLTK